MTNLPEPTGSDWIDENTIRREWYQEEWYYSVIDIIAVLIEGDHKRAKNYYNVLKTRLRKEGNETITNCNQLKLLAADGKRYYTDVMNAEQILRLIQSIPSPKAEPMKLWLAQVGNERLEELKDPELGLFNSFSRAVEEYRFQGKSESWIEARIQGIVTRKEFVSALRQAVLDAPADIYVGATEKLYKGLWQRTTAQLRGDLKINKKANPRDHFGKYALIYTRIAEEISTEKLQNVEDVAIEVATDIVWTVAVMIGKQAREVSQALGYDLVTEKPLLPPTSSKQNKRLS